MSLIPFAPFAAVTNAQQRPGFPIANDLEKSKSSIAMTNQRWSPRSFAASSKAPYSGSEPQLFVCWLSAAICEGIVLICKASLFIHTRKSLQSFAGAALSSRAEAMGSSGQCKVTTAIQRSS
jgi:hypothetical protein